MTAIATADPRAHKAKVVEVWDQLWINQPTDARDDELLARERASRRWRLILDRMTQTFGRLKGLRTIELGSGRGDISALLAQEGADVTLLDSSDRAIHQARARFERLGLSAEFRKGDLFTDSAAHDGYDVALSSGVIEHFRDDQRTHAVKSHRDALHDRGMAIISVPNAHCPPYRIWKAWLELRQCWPYGYEQPYSRRELIRRARKVGFQRTEVRGFAFRQALADQMMPLLTGRRTRTRTSDSIFDDRMGLALIFFGWNS
jgi:2-polyprenyl-3-methyl-5-hydroxy-6-metoxy-1,4-benzoquinol methylase